jgi:hypothetical protein
VRIRWKHIWEFLEEYRWEPAERQPALFHDEPAATGDEQWDVLLAAVAEHLRSTRPRATGMVPVPCPGDPVVPVVAAVQAHGGPGVGARRLSQARRLPLDS